MQDITCNDIYVHAHSMHDIGSYRHVWNYSMNVDDNHPVTVSQFSAVSFGPEAAISTFWQHQLMRLPFILLSSFLSYIPSVGWWENLQETPIFDSKIHGFLWIVP